MTRSERLKEEKPLEVQGRAGKDDGIGKPKKWAVVLVQQPLKHINTSNVINSLQKY